MWQSSSSLCIEFSLYKNNTLYDRKLEIYQKYILSTYMAYINPALEWYYISHHPFCSCDKLICSCLYFFFKKNTDLVAWFQWFLVCASGEKNTHTYMYYMYMYCWEGKIFLWPSKFLLACLRIKLKWDRLTGEKFNFVHKRISHTQEVQSQVRNVKWGIYATLS